MNDIKIREIKHGGFPINHEIAGIVPMALPREQAALTEDIHINGQTTPIVIWKGCVVDGRCRQQALLSLGNRDIKYTELSDSLTEEEVMIVIKSTHIRRNLTATQKAMVAASDYLRSRGKSRPKTASMWGISTTILDNAIKITAEYPTFAKPLFDGLSVTIEDKDGRSITTNKITAVYAHIIRIAERLKNVNAEVIEYAWSADSFITTQVGKEWFYKFIRIHDIKNVDIMKEIAVAANARFSCSSLHVGEGSLV